MNAIVERIGWVLVHSLWQLSLIALMAAAFTFLLRKHSSLARYGTLTFGLLLMVASPLVTWRVMPAERDSVTEQGGMDRTPPSADLRQASGSMASAPDAASVIEIQGQNTVPTAAVDADRESLAAQGAASSVGLLIRRTRDELYVAVQPWLSTLVAAWFLGALLCSLRPAWGWLCVRRLLRTGISPVNQEIQQSLIRLCDRMRVRRRVSIAASSLVRCPVVVGCLRAVILVPTSLVGSIPIGQLEAILAHELAHVRRYDFVVNLLQSLIETIFFYHPAVWWLSHQMRMERENCCDDMVVGVLGNRVEYGRALLAVEEYRGMAPTGLAIGARDGSLLARVRRLMADAGRDNQRGNGGLVAGTMLVMGMLAAIFWSATLTRAQAPGVQPTANGKTTQRVDEDLTQPPWRAMGLVTDGEGKPLAGVTVVAATGIGTLRGGGSGVTDEQGHYDFRFGLGVRMTAGEDGKTSPQTQYALISARLEGHFEKTFSQQGDGIASLEPLTDDEAKRWGVEPEQICLPGKPREVNFVMLPAARMSGTLVGKDDQPLKDYSVALVGERLPPGSSALSQVVTDADGRFEITNIPTNAAYQIEVRKPRAELKPPWDDSWATGPLLFTDPGENDLSTTSAEPEKTLFTGLVAKRFRLKIVGPGIPGKSALARGAENGIIESLEAEPKDASGRFVANELVVVLSNEASADEDATADLKPLPPAPTKTLPDSLNVMSVAFDADGKLWSIAARHHINVRQWDLLSGEKLRDVELESDKHANRFLRSELQFSGDRSRVLAIDDGKIAIWDSITGKRQTALDVPSGLNAHRGLCSSGDFTKVACGMMQSGGFLPLDAKAVIWDPKTGVILRTITHADAVQIHCTSLSPDGRLLATGSQETGLCVWDVDSGELKHHFANENTGRQHPDAEVGLKSASQVLSVCFSPDGKQVAMSDLLGVKVLDANSGKLLHDFQRPFRFGGSGLVFSTDGNLLARVDTDQVISLWNLATGKATTELASESHGGGFSNDGSWFAAGFTDETTGIRAWRFVKPGTQPAVGDNAGSNPDWLRFCPGTQIIERTQANFVSGIVVDEVGRPIAGCSVEHPGLVGPLTDDNGKFQYQQSMPHRTVLRAYHRDYRLWFGAPQPGDVLRIVLQKKRKVEAVAGAREMMVRVIDSRTAEPVPHVLVTVRRDEGPRRDLVAASGSTNEDGTVLLRQLDFIPYRVSLSAERPIPYVGKLANPSADQNEVILLVDRACELVLRAVDSETGKGIPGVRFDRERALAELWAEPVVSDILGSRDDANQGTVTDNDGFVRHQVGPETWSYMILKYPEGYGSVVPIEGRQEVEIATPSGGKVEYTFRLVKR